jgi:hypothetical protein
MSRKCSNSDVRPFRTRRMPTPLPPCRSASTPTREYELYIMYLHIKKNHQSFFSLRLHLHKPGSSWDAPPVASSTILFASSSPPQHFASARASTSSSLSLPPPHCSVVPRVELVAGAATFCSSSPPRAAILLLVLQYSEGHWDMVLLARPLYAVALLGLLARLDLAVATPAPLRRAASICSLSSSPINTAIPYQVGRGRVANAVSVFKAFSTFVSNVSP